jgi:DNA-binding MarR family transcriptional regulator
MPVSPAACERITSNLSRLVRTGRHLAARAAEQLYGELPSFGWTLLVPLERDGEQRCSALAAHAGVDVSVVSRQVATLEKAGYVERRPDPRDGRASLIGLTPAGAAALVTTRAERAHWAASALASWEEQDAEQLGALLERLLADLESAPPKQEPPKQELSKQELENR